MRTAARFAIGVMGSASGEHDEETTVRLARLGRAIAERGCILVTGGLTIGISPGLSRDEHERKYGSPTDVYDVLIYTGSGLMGREMLNIRSSDIVVIAGGHSGTLGEFAIAYDEGKLIGVLTGTGGIADRIDELVRLCQKDTGAAVLYDDDPVRLLDRLIEYYITQHAARPNCFCTPDRPAHGPAQAVANHPPAMDMQHLPAAPAADRFHRPI